MKRFLIDCFVFCLMLLLPISVVYVAYVIDSDVETDSQKLDKIIKMLEQKEKKND